MSGLDPGRWRRRWRGLGLAAALAALLGCAQGPSGPRTGLLKGNVWLATPGADCNPGADDNACSPTGEAMLACGGTATWYVAQSCLGLERCAPTNKAAGCIAPPQAKDAYAGGISKPETYVATCSGKVGTKIGDTIADYTATNCKGSKSGYHQWCGKRATLLFAYAEW